jgi:ribosomal-protein-alanine N-acetyltransferase
MAVIAPTMRPLVVDDLAAVLAIEREVFPAPWTEGMFLDELGAGGRRYLAAVEDGSIVGYGGIMVIDGDAHVMNLAVVPRRRRRGLASRLLLALIDEALGLGASHLTLELRASNEPARLLYERFGFTPVGVRPRYYGDEDALVMWALDADAPAFRDRLDRLREETA